MADELDLDMIAEDLLKFYDDVEVVVDENKKLHKEQLITDKRLYAYNTSQKNMNEEIAGFQEIISNYQQTLVTHNQLQEENIGLKKRVEELVVDRSAIEQELRSANEKFLEEFQNLQKKHSNDVETIKQQANEAAINELTLYESKVKSLNEEITKCKSTMQDKEKQKNAEVSKLKLEYDCQLQKLRQKQLAHAHSSGGMATKNDIFRKKLQHHQAESEKEVRCLKSTINEQQIKISNLLQQVDGLKKNIQDEKKQHGSKDRQNEKHFRQHQNEILSLRSQLKEQRDKNMELIKSFDRQREEFEKEKQSLTTNNTKRRKSMFNPQTNYLGTPK